MLLFQMLQQCILLMSSKSLPVGDHWLSPRSMTEMSTPLLMMYLWNIWYIPAPRKGPNLSSAGSIATQVGLEDISLRLWCPFFFLEASLSSFGILLVWLTPSWFVRLLFFFLSSRCGYHLRPTLYPTQGQSSIQRKAKRWPGLFIWLSLYNILFTLNQTTPLT